ncbi:glycosyltransferase [Granulosicoccus sp.]|nr:glycosyltransferase [Granulosicoccus sp.]
MSYNTASDPSTHSTALASVSFVLPALNECEHIERSVASIQQHGKSWVRELIVVDNGSIDGTPEIAAKAGATVIHFPEGTVAAARNRGVVECAGDVLVFLDADVSLTSEWETAFPAVLDSLTRTPQQVTGSRCAPEARNDFLTRYWFARLTHTEARYVNSGHLVTTRALFDAIGGFDAERETAEDYDFCMRASAAGALIKNQENLRAVHHDYPSTLSAFVAREAWHGRDDFKDASSLGASRIGLIVCLNLVLLVLCLIVALAISSLVPLLLYVIFAATLLIGLTIAKFGRSSLNELLGTSVVFAVYLCGRTLSLLQMFRERVLASKSRLSK